MADKWGWKLPETRVFEVRPEAGRVKRKKWVVRHGSCTLCRRKEVRSFFRLCPEQSFLRWFSPRGSFLFCFSFHCSQCIYAAALYELYSNAHPAFVFILITLRLRLSLLFLHHSRRSLLLQRWFPPLLRTHRNCPLPRIPLLLRSRSLLPRVPGSRS